MKKLLLFLSAIILTLPNLKAQDEPGLDPGEQALLQSITEQLRPVYYEDYDASYNATIQDGHVTAWDFSYFFGDFPMSVVPELFKFPYVQAITITEGHLTGDIALLVDPTNIACADSLKVVNVNNNHLSGNIGAFAAHFPNLTELHATYNRLSEVHPMISPKVTWLEIYYQSLDEPIMLDIRNRLTLADVIAALPEILRYNHETQTYNTGMEWSVSYPDAGFTLAPYEEDEQTYFGVNAWGWGVLAFTNHDTVHITNYTRYADVPFTLRYRMADVNFNSTIDVTDLQAMINHIMNTLYFSPINTNAADLYPDSVINVQDVVRMVDTLLTHEVPVVFESPRRVASTEPAEAALYWQDGDLHLYSSKVVASMQIRLDDAVNWQLTDEWVKGERVNGEGTNVVIYSLNGATLPAETDIVLAHSANEVSVRYAALADTKAQAIDVRLNSPAVVTGLEGVTGYRLPVTEKVIRDGQLIIIRDGKEYNILGQMTK